MRAERAERAARGGGCRPSPVGQKLRAMVAAGETDPRRLMQVPGASRSLVRTVFKAAGVPVQKVQTIDAVTLWERTRRRDEVLALLEVNERGMTVDQLADAIGCNVRRVQNAIFSLQQDGCVRRTGERVGRSPYFEVVP